MPYFWVQGPGPRLTPVGSVRDLEPWIQGMFIQLAENSSFRSQN